MLFTDIQYGETYVCISLDQFFHRQRYLFIDIELDTKMSPKKSIVVLDEVPPINNLPFNTKNYEVYIYKDCWYENYTKKIPYGTIVHLIK